MNKRNPHLQNKSGVLEVKIKLDFKAGLLLNMKTLNEFAKNLSTRVSGYLITFLDRLGLLLHL